MSILGIILLIILISCAGWILRALGFMIEISLGCLFKGLMYAFCAFIIIMLIAALL